MKRKSTVINLSLLLMLALLCSCSTIMAPYKKVKVWNERRIVRSIQESETEQKIFDGVPEPKMPSNWDNDSTLAGIDSNSDGVRDDVEIWINRRWNNPDLRNGFKQLARAVQKMILSSDVSDGELKETSTQVNKAYACIHLFFGNSSTVAQLEDHEVVFLEDMMTYSSWERRYNWVSSDERSLRLGLDLQTWKVKEICKFEIINNYLKLRKN